MPVPLHNRKLRDRGFNQALELARWALIGLSRAPQLGPGGGLPRLERSLLHRARATRELGRWGTGGAAIGGRGRVRRQRHRARARSARAADRRRVHDGRDVQRMRHALLAAGSAAVHVLALARAV